MTKKLPGGEGEGIEFHTWGMRKARPVLAGVGVNGYKWLNKNCFNLCVKIVFGTVS